MTKQYSLILISLLAVAMLAACGKPQTTCDPECSSDQVCNDGACVAKNPVCNPACSPDQECKAGTCVAKSPVCNPACSPDQECKAGTCVAKSPVDPNACNPACPPDQECKARRCVAKSPVDPNACNPACLDYQECKAGTCKSKTCTNDTSCGSSAKCVKNKEGEKECVLRTELCQHVKCLNNHYRCEEGKCIPTCGDASLCGGICCADDQVCFNNKCIAKPDSSGRSNYLCQESSTAPPEYCPRDHACFTKADGSGDHCVKLSNECDNSTSFCRIGQFCDFNSGHCVKLTEAHICRVGAIGASQKEVGRWTGSGSSAPAYNQVMAAPAVADIDPNRKGSEIVITTYQGGAYTEPGVLRVLSSENVGTSNATIPELTEIWSSQSITNKFFVSPNTTPAIGDIDNDGKPDIVIDAWKQGGSLGGTDDANHKLIAIKADGSEIFRVDFGKYYPHTEARWNNEADSFGVTGPMIVDLDEDGNPEIIAHHLIYDNQGNLKCNLKMPNKFADSEALKKNYPPLVSAAVDFDGDGKKEIVAEQGLFTYDKTNGCHLVATSTKVPKSSTEIINLVSIADLDGDGSPEIIGINDTGQLTYETVSVEGSGASKVYRRDLVGTFQLPIDRKRAETEKSHPKGYCDRLENKTWDQRECLVGGGKPNIADFDGDGKPEIGIATRYYYVVVKPGLKDVGHGRVQFDDSLQRILWAYKTEDFSSAGTSSSVFDFDGDGKAEVVYNDEKHLYVFKGASSLADVNENGHTVGEAPIRIKNTTATRREYPVIVDLNGDGHANIVVAANDSGTGTGNHGIRVFADQDNKWVATRKIWNQFAYYVTNVDDDGSIPQHEQKNWKLPWLNNYLQNVQKGDATFAPDLTAVIKSAFDGDCSSSAAQPKLVFDIKNLGDAKVAAGAFHYKIEAIKTENSDRMVLGEAQNKTEIAAKGKETVSFDWAIPTGWDGKEMSLQVTVDSKGEITECKETNNEETVGNVQAAAPNLIVVAQTPSCDSSQYSLEYTIRNDSTVDLAANKVKVSIYVGTNENSMRPAVPSFEVNEAISAGGTLTKTLLWPAPSDLQNQSLRFKIVLDEENHLVECREDDNVAITEPLTCFSLG